MLRLLIVGVLLATGTLPTRSSSPLVVDDDRPRPATREELLQAIWEIENSTTRPPASTRAPKRIVNNSFEGIANYSRSDDKYYARIGPKNKVLSKDSPPPPDAPRTEEELRARLGVPEPKPNVDNPRLKVHGEFGKNYFTEFGRPYINCAVSDYEHPLEEEDEFGNRTVRKYPPETKKCFLEFGSNFERLSCMTVLRYKGTDAQLKADPNPRRNIVIQKQSCWTNQEKAIEGCTKGPSCIFNGAIQAGKQMFCCCNEHNCNDHIQFDPSKETDPDLFDAAREQMDKDHAIKHETKVEFVRPAKPTPPPGHWLEVVVVLTVLTMFAAVAACFFAVKKWRMRKNKEEAGPAVEALIPRVEPREKHWEIVRNSMTEIGQGKYGMVYKAEWRADPTAALKTVAVKVFKGNSQSFQNELFIYREDCMQKCMKPSILRLLEYDEAEQTLITEYHEMGNLHHFLKQRSIDQPLDCLSLIVSLLEALTFLHEERGLVHGDPKPVILHRDIKSHNVLLKMDSRNRLVGVLMDFGLSMRTSQVYDTEPNIKNMMHKVVGTQRYMAPELLVGAAELDITHFKAIDVYAMALVIWEILSRTRVFPSDEVPAYMEPLESDLRKEQPRDPIRLSTYRLVVVAQKKRPTFRKEIKNDRILKKVTNSLEEMWEHDAGCRVSAACVLRRMEVLFDEGYHSGTMEGGQSNCSVKSNESDLEKTPPPSRISTPDTPDNKTVVYEADETTTDTAGGESLLQEATRLLGAVQKLAKRDSSPEEIELQEVR